MSINFNQIFRNKSTNSAGLPVRKAELDTCIPNPLSPSAISGKSSFSHDIQHVWANKAVLLHISIPYLRLPLIALTNILKVPSGTTDLILSTFPYSLPGAEQLSIRIHPRYAVQHWLVLYNLFSCSLPSGLTHHKHQQASVRSFSEPCAWSLFSASSPPPTTSYVSSFDSFFVIPYLWLIKLLNQHL